MLLRGPRRFALVPVVASGLLLIPGAGCGGTEDASAAAAGTLAPDAAAADAPVEATVTAYDAGIRADRFATEVVSFTPGACAGFGASAMPGVVLGPPKGAPPGQGSTDVVSLGTGGEIVLSFGPNAVVDGPGPDLLVFENPFYPAGSSTPFAEPGEVSVSEDGVVWHSFPCTATAAPWGACAGWHPVALVGPGVSPVVPAEVGGDPFDLAELGVARARYVRIRDRGEQACPTRGPNTNGFDLDAIAAVNAEQM